MLHFSLGSGGQRYDSFDRPPVRSFIRERSYDDYGLPLRGSGGGAYRSFNRGAPMRSETKSRTRSRSPSRSTNCTSVARRSQSRSPSFFRRRSRSLSVVSKGVEEGGKLQSLSPSISPDRSRSSSTSLSSEMSTHVHGVFYWHSLYSIAFFLIA